MDKEYKLIEIYFCVCKKFEKGLKVYCERFSNNDEPEFTDQEIINKIKLWE